ncbi:MULTISPECIES: 1-hydroxycarotenoid 3,4-desaturase CrtD [unclassified Pedobacter]|uniref:1-hydroxycarotenoid 3,4-desaturase CrtD n=1 Tax=unclassified Pedobacter TaxID=2628915 RepID=UPI001D1F3D22|nr:MULTISPECIES: 1-hydroxycarotenoid 3,4-desaturase CrtD [unclassified Pedobacter]CAH0296963.1 Dehydrosqualene desaturase [Pedobacter sp. Bi36]CAH0307584.1 Dehydrosqualene desaturase [Pedobacter sp. Bi126]
MSKPKAIIIGAGIAGIASAIRLSLKGYEVDVFEANSKPGGKLTEIKMNGFRFDAGPSLFTMPQYVDELFKLAGKNPEDYFEYLKLKEICRYFYEDGLWLNARADLDEFAKEIEEKTDSTAKEVERYLNKSKTIYEVTHRVFLERSLHKIKSYLHWDTLKSIFRFGQIDAFRTQAKANRSFFKDDRIAQLFNRYATYNGSDPYQAPATLNIIPHFEYHYGAFLPTNGMYSIVTALVKLAEELGIRFHYNQKVEEIIYSNGLKPEVQGVKVNDKNYKADVVVSNLDIWFTYKNLLKNIAQPKKLLNQERSSSALIFYWGMDGNYSDMGLHNIFFAEDYQKEFNAIWKEKTISIDPTVYVNISCKHIRADAPTDSENWFVMINVPANNGQNWDVLIKEARTNIIKKISRILNRNIEKDIICEQILDPRSIESKTGSYQGSLYGNSSNNQFSAFLRHPNFSSKVKNLYFCGGSVHPGGGIPLALLSARIIDDGISSVAH